VVTIDDVLSVYDTTTHPDVAQGGKSTQVLFAHISHVVSLFLTSPAQEAAEEMLGHFQQGDHVNGVLTWPEFLDYYKGLSVGIDDDNYFELMIRNAWHLSGGEGSASNSTCRRVLVIHGDGSQEVYLPPISECRYLKNHLMIIILY